MSDPLRILIHNADTSDAAARTRSAHPGAIVEECTSYAALPAHLSALRPDIVYTVRFAGSDGYPRDALFGPDGPRWVANGGAGTDHFGVWDAARVTVTNAAGVAAEMMAEYVMGGFLHFTLDVPGLQSDKAQQRWRERVVRPLKGTTLLVVGLGQTGGAIARLAQAFGMRVIGTRARPAPMDHVDEVYPAESLLAVLPQADFIAVCTPLTPATRNLLNAEAFAVMKSGVVLADVSRGGVIDQSPLLSALQSGKIAGAGLDVFETEPLPSDNPFWDLNNIILSPHCSAVHDQWEQDSFNLFLDNLQNWENGDPLFNIVDPNRGY